MIICATGHRPHKLGKEYNLKGPYSEFIYEFMMNFIAGNSPTKIISGMALGVDQLWAIAGIRSGIEVIAAIPFIGQESVWPQSSQQLYKEILKSNLVEEKIISDGNYSIEKMHIRDKWMVDNSDLVFAVWNGTGGGTQYTVDYAKEQNKEIEILNPDGWR